MAITALPSPQAEDLFEKDQSPPCPRTLKRKRSLPLTPPCTVDDPDSKLILSKAVHVLSTEATALSHVTRLYQTDPVAQDGLLRAVQGIAKANEAGGKVIVCGVGKSGLIGMKAVATLKSLSIAASFMHAAEAMHGDLGDVKSNDVLLFITFSGRTAELLTIMSHLPPTMPIFALTSHTSVSTCPLLDTRPGAILLPAPIHEPEATSFGLSAPTTSTTVALAVTDMLALAVADWLHRTAARAREVFHANHPGGAIGASCKASSPSSGRFRLLADVAIPVEEIPRAVSRSAIDVLRAAAGSRSGWVRTGDWHVLRPRDVQCIRGDAHISELERAFPATYWRAPVGVTVAQAAKIASLTDDPASEPVVGLVAEDGDLVAVVDVEELVSDSTASGDDFEWVDFPIFKERRGSDEMVRG